MISWTAFGITIVFFVMGMVFTAIMAKSLNVQGGAFYASLFLAPAFVYLIFSGQIREFSGFGIEAKLGVIASTPIGESIASIRDIAVLSEQSVAELGRTTPQREMLQIPQEAEFIVLDDEAEDDIMPIALRLAERIYVGLLSNTFHVLIIVNRDETVVGYFPKHWFYDLLPLEIGLVFRGQAGSIEQVLEEWRKRIRLDIMQTKLWDILANPEIRVNSWGERTTIVNTATIQEALNMMRENKLEIAVLVDRRQRFDGIVLRDDVVATMLDNILSQAAERTP